MENSTPADVLTDLGSALAAFGLAVQTAGQRLRQIEATRPQAPPPTIKESLKVPLDRLPAQGFLRLPDIIGRKASKKGPAIPALIPVCSATWYAGIQSGRFPKPVKLGTSANSASAWRVEDIRALLEHLAQPVQLTRPHRRRGA